MPLSIMSRTSSNRANSKVNYSHVGSNMTIIYSPFGVVTGGYNFTFHVTLVTFASSEMDVTPRKRSKIITLNGHTSMCVGDVATVVDVGASSVLRFLIIFSNKKIKNKMWI
ncbi:hypothetical protein TNCV_3813991 [Trichonephila clavipes]|nr:hypothetical protein TNCV_3813991 [Trichonephila clavipes]